MILLPGDLAARAVEADALWLAGHEGRALSAYAALARDGHRDAVERARALYRSRAGTTGRALAAMRPLFAAMLRTGRLRLP